MLDELRCPRLPEALALYEGELDSGSEPELRAHVAQCPCCRSAWDEEERVSTLLQVGDPAAPLPNPARLRMKEALLAAAEQSLAEERAPASRGKARPWLAGWRSVRWGWALVPAALLLLFLWRPAPSRPGPQTAVPPRPALPPPGPRSAKEREAPRRAVPPETAPPVAAAASGPVRLSGVEVPPRVTPKPRAVRMAAQGSSAPPPRPVAAVPRSTPPRGAPPRTPEVAPLPERRVILAEGAADTPAPEAPPSPRSIIAATGDVGVGEGSFAVVRSEEEER